MTMFLFTIWIMVLVVCCCVVPITNGFVIPLHHIQSSAEALGRGRRVVILEEKIQSMSAAEMFASDGWEPIKKDLDSIPIFTVATKEGNPLAYEIDMNGNKFSVPMFHTDIADSLAELEAAKENKDIEGIDVIPFPLGQAFQLWAEDKAVIVPSKQAVLQAGAPPGTNPIGQQVPLFTCMEIMEEGEDGKGRLPLFMSLDDANAAVQSAVDAEGGKTDDFEVVPLSLNGAVEQLATIPETPGFNFIPPSSSMKYIQEYLS